MSDEPTEQVQADIQMLLDACVEYAQGALEERGMFPPVAVALGNEPDEDGDDEISLFEPDPEPDGEEQVQEAIEGLEEHLTSNRHDYRAAAIAFDVAGEDGDWDAITVLVSHSDGTTVDIQVPYKDNEFGEVSTFVGTMQVWS